MVGPPRPERRTPTEWNVRLSTTNGRMSPTRRPPATMTTRRSATPPTATGVQHRNQYGGSTWAESGEVTLLAVPGRPTGLAATVDGNDNILSWTGPEDSIIDGYRVRHRIADADWKPSRRKRRQHGLPPRRCRSRRNPPLRRAGPQLRRRRLVVRHRVHPTHHAARQRRRTSLRNSTATTSCWPGNAPTALTSTATPCATRPATPRTSRANVSPRARPTSA